MLKKGFCLNIILLLLVNALIAQQANSKKGGTSSKKGHHKTQAATVPTKVAKDSLTKKPEKDTLHVVLGEVFKTLINGNGWVKNDYGKWINSPARIPYEDADLNNVYYNKYEVGKDNFKEMDILPVSIKGKKYYVLAVRFLKAMQEEQKDKTKEWKCYPAVEYYVLPSEELKKITAHKNVLKENSALNLRFIYFGNYFCFSAAQFKEKMKKRIEWNITNDHPDDSSVDCYFQISLSPKKTKVGTMLRLNYSLTYPAKDNVPADPDYTLFDEQFYEIPVANWYRFTAP